MKSRGNFIISSLSAGICTKSVLWLDDNVFSNSSESSANAFKYSLTERALQMFKNISFN